MFAMNSKFYIHGGEIYMYSTFRSFLLPLLPLFSSPFPSFPDSFSISTKFISMFMNEGTGGGKQLGTEVAQLESGIAACQPQVWSIFCNWGCLPADSSGNKRA